MASIKRLSENGDLKQIFYLEENRHAKKFFTNKKMSIIGLKQNFMKGIKSFDVNNLTIEKDLLNLKEIVDLVNELFKNHQPFDLYIFSPDE